jgi:anti-sigma regulatory factor (Ser/Thr protein kinase)
MAAAVGSVRDRTMSFRAVVGSVPEARRAVDGIVALDEHPEIAFNVRLLVSELVGNSVRHSGVGPADEIGVTVAVSDDRVRVAVIDHGKGFLSPTVVQDPGRAVSGRGLYLVDALSDRWAVESGDGRTCVWFEIDIDSHQS